MRIVFFILLLVTSGLEARPHCSEGWDLPSSQRIAQIFGTQKTYYRPDSESRQGRSYALIQFYTMPGNYSYINRELRSFWPDPQYVAIASLIEQSLCSAPQYQGVVYRGIKTQLKYKQGKKVKFKGFLSTSKKESIARSFGEKTFYIIKSQTGRDVSNISMCLHEEEVLFPPNTEFRITHVGIDNVIEMEEITQ